MFDGLQAYDNNLNNKKKNRESTNAKAFKKTLKSCKPLAILYAKFAGLLVR